VPERASRDVKVRLTRTAQRDVKAVLNWSRKEFGEAAMSRYQALIKQAARDIGEDPERPGSKEQPGTVAMFSMSSSESRTEGFVNIKALPTFPITPFFTLHVKSEERSLAATPASEGAQGMGVPSGRWNRWQPLFAVLFRLDGQTLEWRVSEILHNVSRSWIQINGTCFNAVLHALSV
jgi:plasmid stabilization system protein ParE